jgi:transposase
MRSQGSADELVRRRLLAVRRLEQGYSIQEIAEFLGVSFSSVWRWQQAFRRGGEEALAARPVPGRPPRLTRTQEKIALRWLNDSPSEHGFDTELWTAARLAELIHEEWGIALNDRYVCRWLAARGFSPQRPQRVPRERSPQAIAAWLDAEWTRIKKKRPATAVTSFSSMKAEF